MRMWRECYKRYANAGHSLEAKYKGLVKYRHVTAGCWDGSEGTTSRGGARAVRRLQQEWGMSNLLEAMQ